VTTPRTSGSSPRALPASAEANADKTRTCVGPADGSVSTGYIMEGPTETQRLRLKTEHVLVRRHLDWTGLLAGQSFVDFGCGTGEVVLVAAEHCRPGRVVGLDGNRKRLAALSCEAALQGLTNVEVRAAAIAGPASTGLPSGAYDHGWARFFLEYQPTPAGVVSEMARIVRPGGRVTLIDLEGNGVWHYGMETDLASGLAEVIADLGKTGFDPHIGRRLPDLASAAGLRDVRHEIEPYHRIVGRPDADTMAAWRLKIHGLRANYLRRFPERRSLAWVFDAYLDFLARDDTMTWSLLHLVQGTVPNDASRRGAAPQTPATAGLAPNQWPVPCIASR
jgi:SAM-dependent methyltransferase